MSAEPSAMDTAAASVTVPPTSIDHKQPTPPPSDVADSTATAGKQNSSKKPSGSGVAAGLRGVDAALEKLGRVAQTRSGTNAVLLFAAYGAAVSGNLLEAGSRAALQSKAARLVALALQLPPSTTLSLSSRATGLSPLAIVALRLSARLKALGALISEVRTFNRIWNLLEIYLATKKFVLSLRQQSASSSDGGEKKQEDKGRKYFDVAMTAASLASFASFQVTESVALLGERKILPVSPRAQDRLAMWCVRSWCASTVLDILRLVVERGRRLRDVADDEKTIASADHQAWADRWQTDMLRSLAWFPSTVHYSVGGGLLSELTIAALSFYPGVSGFMETWNATA